MPFTGRNASGFLRQIFLTSPSSPAHPSRLSRRAGGRKSWSPQRSIEKFPLAFAKSSLCLPRGCLALLSPAALGLRPELGPQQGLLLLPVVSCIPAWQMLLWPDSECEPHSVPVSCCISHRPPPLDPNCCTAVDPKGVCGWEQKGIALKHTHSGHVKDRVFKLCLDYVMLCKLWRKKRESLGVPVKEKSPRYINKI